MQGPALLNQILYSLGAPPDEQSFDVSPKRRLQGGSALTPVPANGSVTLTAPVALQETLGTSDGLLLDMAAGIITAGDTTGHLQVVDTALLLLTPTPTLIVPLGTPQPTTLFPRANISLLFTLPPLLTFRDLQQWALKLTVDLTLPANQPLLIQLAVSLANNDAAAHNAQIQFWCAYRKVSGLMGA